jgi:hypothetical protein
LIRKRGSLAVVPNHVISSFHFFFERHLGIDHRFGGRAVHAHLAHKIGQLDVGRTSDHDHAVAQGFTSGFIEKWNVCEEKFGSIAVPVRFNAPLPANPRMENLFERAPFRDALENYGSKSGPIQVAAWGKDPRPELVAELMLNFLKIDKLVSSLVGIEELGLGHKPSEAIAEGAFACGNSAGDSDCGHGLNRRISRFRAKRKAVRDLNTDRSGSDAAPEKGVDARFPITL